MNCVADGLLRAQGDGELSQAEELEVKTHLASCPDCRRRAEVIAREAARASEVLSLLAPLAGEAPADAGIAYARLRAQEVGRKEEVPSLLAGLFSRRLRPAWGAVALAALLAGFLGFAPARSWAQRILAMLRVQKIAVVSINPDIVFGPNGDNRAGKMIGQMLSDNVVVTLSPGKPQTAATAEAASELAGFKVRVLGSRADAPQFRIEGEQAFHMTLNRDRLQAIVEEAGRPDLDLPASLDGATIAVHIPKVVLASYGCPEFVSRDEASPPAASGPNQKSPAPGFDSSNCVMLVEAPSPTVSVPPDLNIAQVAEAGLELAGMSAEKAHAFCQTVDWTSTLVIPVPREAGSFQTVEVDGVEGTLIDIPPRGRRAVAEHSLLWIKNGVIYSLIGRGNSADAVTLAESLN